MYINGDKDRYVYIDYLRCFGIILMIMGHIEFNDVFDKWIHAFHMPLWFFVSGYFCRTEKEVLSQIKRRIRLLIIPYLIFSVIYIVINRILLGVWIWRGCCFQTEFKFH